MSESEVRQTEVIPQWKREEVDELVDFIESYESVGVVGVAGIPSRQLQAMRRELHGSAAVRMSRNTLANRALDEVDDGFEELKEYIAGQVALIGTNDNPFALYKELEASKTPAPINAGEVAPNDIVIPEGDTGVDPGPFVGELQQVGASARIMDGSIKVTEDSNVLSAGEEVSEELANVLAELGIEPKEVGLDLRGVFSEGVLFEPDELAIDVDEYRADIQSAVSAATNLSVNAVYPTAQTAPTLIAKATSEAKAVGLFANIESPDFMPELISKADAQLRALAANIDDEEALPEELRGVSAADTGAAEEEESTDEEAADADEADADADEDAAEDDGDDDEDAGDALGSLF
ncbi:MULTISPECIES: 50S ribosomal protein L10 [Haloferax]|uniref:Large ribosomal subunit protein uL10 n=2 Tax=Haloferax gibbonsii TaxID=35746 RepID=A0A0K1IWU2_HALGI|nr:MULTISPECIES: 50S ribosomal protein L10 [Haloferax]AKU08758.1 50S ribosomal protein L10 [Haloferax gibbonsii]ELZ81105.1 acidic ribosomal protein P0 [Haloferax gibbonsii ATCC 33959]QOS12066.1 50S ribosomal protein L10 [Haloferax gibbonsii]RDZ52102.1 50S ribosomal protein L10 [Haloferax sp. Atlit-4N]REA01220.1 50S ribosomal protein L10 [Haloferax sp. Atlit-6N]